MEIDSALPLREPAAVPKAVSARQVWSRVIYPPVGELSFWAAVTGVVALAVLHLYVDLSGRLEGTGYPEGSPVALLLLPVLYSALRYGLAGSAATGLLATVLWLPDLLLPGQQGHPEGDLTNLLITDAVGIFVGLHLDREKAGRRRERNLNYRYRELFESSLLPIVLANAGGTIVDANPAARSLFGEGMIGESTAQRFGVNGNRASMPIATADGETRIFRLLLNSIWIGDHDGGPLRQLVLQDVSQEHGDLGAARSYAGILLAAQESERSRIARDLHDDPLQRLMHLARRMESAGVPGAETYRDDLLEVISRLREITRGLRPPGLEQFGLVAAVRGLLVDIEADGGPGIGLEVSGDAVPLRSELELAAFRIIQEAVRNALRHASPRAVRVDLDYGPESLGITICDDGCGFDPPAVASLPGIHVGLIGMRERTMLLGGEFTLSSRRGGGTTVEARLPRTAPVPGEISVSA